MNFLHIHSTDISGGAAVSMYRLHQALKSTGQGSRILCGRKFSKEEDSTPLVPGRYGYYINETAGRFFNALGLQGFGNPSGLAIRTSPLVRRWADVIILRNLHGDYFPLEVLPWLAEQVPLIWRLPDMWALTGHCAYSYECERWKNGCGRCPHLSEYPALPFDTTSFLWRYKKNVYQKLRGKMVLVSPSRWLLGLLRESPLLQEFPCEHIPTAVALDIFRPLERSAARASWGINSAEAVLMVSSVDFRESRKGGPELLRCLRALRQKCLREITLLMVGRQKGELNLPSGVRLVNTGFIADENMLAKCYSAADVYLSLSRADNLPNTLVEAAACGVPIVTLNRGGCAETIQEGESGYAVENIEAAAARVGELLENDALRQHFSRRARAVAEERFGMDTQVSAYSKLAKKILAA